MIFLTYNKKKRFMDLLMKLITFYFIYINVKGILEYLWGREYCST